MKLAILSDTHGLLRPQVAERLKGVDAILHGGDINTQGIVTSCGGMPRSTSSGETTTRTGRRSSPMTSPSPWGA